MEPSDVMKIPTTKALLALRDEINLTDRQRDVFYYKFARGWRYIDIAEELGVSQDTISEDAKIIREKLAAISIENISNNT